MKSTHQTLSLKRHCMVVHAYYPLAETRVQRQAEALVRYGYEVDVICLNRSTFLPYEVVNGVHVYRLPIKRTSDRFPGFASRFIFYLIFLILAGLKLIQLYNKKRYGVVQVHNLPDFLVFCALWPKLRGAKVILDIHDVMPEFFAEQTGRAMQSWPVRLVTWQEQLSCRFADHVITVTELWRQALIARGAPASKVSVVMNLADDLVFRCATGSETISPSNGHFRLIYHGTQAERHGLDTLLHAVDRVRVQIPQVCLVLHGRGDFQEKLMHLVDKLQLADHVTFSLSFIDLAKLPNFIRSHDVGIVPYQNDIFTGGILPTKLLEYVAVGLPAIAARTPAIESYFDETMVQFFEPGNVDELAAGILKLYQDQQYRSGLVIQSERFNEQYNWTTHSADYVALIDRLNQHH